MVYDCCVLRTASTQTYPAAKAMPLLIIRVKFRPIYSTKRIHLSNNIKHVAAMNYVVTLYAS